MSAGNHVAETAPQPYTNTTATPVYPTLISVPTHAAPTYKPDPIATVAPIYMANTVDCTMEAPTHADAPVSDSQAPLYTQSPVYTDVALPDAYATVTSTYDSTTAPSSHTYATHAHTGNYTSLTPAAAPVSQSTAVPTFAGHSRLK